MILKWCSICNAAPAVGTLKVILEDGELYDHDACQDCVDKIPAEDWL